MKISISKTVSFLLLALVMLTPISLMAQVNDDGGFEPMLIVEWLTPLVVLGVTALVKFIKPSIPGWATMIVVTALSAAVAWITTLMDTATDLTFIQQTLYGLLAVVINQFYRQINVAVKGK